MLETTMGGSSSTPVKPPIEKLPDPGSKSLAPSKPVTSDHVDVDTGTVDVMENTDDSALRRAIEGQVCQLIIEQTENDAGPEELLVGGDGEGKGAKTERREHVDEEKNGKSFGEEIVYEEDGDEGNVTVGKGRVYDNQNGSRRQVVYPVRPDAEDCAFYMKFSSCKFGSYCKFNHPSRRLNQGVKERLKNVEETSESGQTECKYYLASGGCKYGEECRFPHSSDRTSMALIPELNFLGLPIRPGQKECAYYLRNGSCMYGPNCRFHHPEPTTVTVSDSTSGLGIGGSLPSQLISSPSVSSWSSPRTYNETSPFPPVIYPPTQGTLTPNSEWNGYQASAFTISERSIPTTPAFAINNLPTLINFPVQQQHDLAIEEYPERPGEPDCSFFLKTGDCKYKCSCKYHHPKNLPSKVKANSYVLNDNGLPSRPDQAICTNYSRHGICKYGSSCKYDHPLNFGMLPPKFEQNFW